MSHVLLGGDERQVADLRFLLSKWGLTVGSLAFVDAGPTIFDCDAVVISGDARVLRDAGLGTLPDGSGGAVGPAAPLIFINGGGAPLDSLPEDWLVLGHLADGGGNLQAALQSAFAAARALRGEPADKVGPDGSSIADTYLHFLGHELRSPLTAIKTALEVLEGELGGLDGDGSRPGPGLRMLNIALRNVRRLHQTVEWSQELLAASEAPRVAEPRGVPVAELAARLQGIGSLGVDAEAHGIDLATDPEVLESLTQQMARAVSMACPGSPLHVRVSVDPEDAQYLHVVVAAADGEHGPPAVSNRRTCLVNDRTTAGPASELQRLAGFMVAPQMVRSLGATLRTPASDGDRPALVLTFDLLHEPVPCLTA